MSVIVFYIIPMVLQGIESLILYLPPAPASPDKLSHILFTNRDVGYPTIVVCYFVLGGIYYPVFKVVYPVAVFVAV